MKDRPEPLRGPEAAAVLVAQGCRCTFSGNAEWRYPVAGCPVHAPASE